MRRGIRCRREVINDLINEYDSIVSSQYSGDYLKAIQNFDNIAENNLRSILEKFYSNKTSRDQAWKSCKGELYEYAVFKYLKNTIEMDEELTSKYHVLRGSEGLIPYGDKITIRNWSVIYPDADILVIEKKTESVKVIISCKTSLRERLTETAFWKRELERNKSTRNIKVVFITTDKDNELKIDTNRYILLHVIDCTFVTDPLKYKNVIEYLKEKYSDKKDFKKLYAKLKFIEEFPYFLKQLA